MSLREELLAGGRVELSSTFTLAIDKAREKMEKFQLPDPRFYVLQVMQAIIASGATRVRAEHRADLTSYTLDLYFDGPGYEKEELERLYDFIFESGRNRARDRTRELALGIVSAQALNPHEIRLVSGSHGWIRERNQKERVYELPSPSQQNRFLVRGTGAATELPLLETHCHHCDIEVRVNDRLISSGRDLSGAVPWPNYKFTRGELSGALGLGYGELTQSSLFLLRYGVQFTRRWEPRVQPPVVLICDHPALRKNASQSDVVEDEHYLAFVEQLQQVLLDFSLDLSRQRIPPYHREVVQKFLVQFFGDWFSAPMLFSREDALPEELKKLLGVPLFADLKGRLRSLRETVAAYKADGFLALAKRRMPYVRQTGLLVLVPSSEELLVLTSLFENVRFVDDALTAAGTTPAGLRPPSQPSRLLAQRQVPKGVLGIPDAFPRRLCAWFCKPPVDLGNWESGTFEHHGLSVEVRFDALTPPDQRETVARILVEQEAERLYAHLLDRLIKANRKPEHMASIFRAREHLLAWWRHRVEKSLEGNHTDSVAPRAREALGETAWTARLFETRSGHTASLADMEAWLKAFDTLTVAFGGPRFQDDYALEASPDTVEFLALVFGLDRLNQATLRSNLLHQRQQQQALAGAADAAVLERPEQETEEQELERLRAEFEEGRRAASPLAAPVARAGPAEPEAVAEEPEVPAEAEPAPEPEAPAPTQREKVWQSFVELHKLVFHAFNQAGVSGTLAVCRPTRSTRTQVQTVYLFQGEEPLWEGQLFGLPLAGWLDLGASEAVGAGSPPLNEAQHAALASHCHLLFERLGVLLSSIPPGHRDFALVRLALLNYLGWDLEHSRQRLLSAHDPLMGLRFLPATGGSLCSLQSLFDVVQQHGVLEVIWAGDPDPQRDYVVAVVDDLVSDRFYRSLFRCDTRRAVPRGRQAAPELLLANLRKELRQLRGRGDFMLSDSMLANIYWGEAGKYFIQHDAESGSTILNPGHRVVKRVLDQMHKDPTVVPVLASSVYTAINRALEEVEDRHELAFLEALLESHPG